MKRVIAVIVSVMLATTSGLALAKPGVNTGGKSASHMSAKGQTNTNGPEATDRDKGQARSSDRKNASAMSHEQVGKHGKKQPK